jgi:hypothetical protein
MLSWHTILSRSERRGGEHGGKPMESKHLIPPWSEYWYESTPE